MIYLVAKVLVPIFFRTELKMYVETMTSMRQWRKYFWQPTMLFIAFQTQYWSLLNFYRTTVKWFFTPQKCQTPLDLDWETEKKNTSEIGFLKWAVFGINVRFRNSSIRQTNVYVQTMFNMVTNHIATVVSIFCDIRDILVRSTLRKKFANVAHKRECLTNKSNEKKTPNEWHKKNGQIEDK